MPTLRHIKWAKFRVVVVVIVAALILSVLAYLLTGGTLFASKATLYAYIPDATGLAASSLVRVDGIEIGRVDRVGLSGSSRPERAIRVVMRVERERLPSVPVDSYAEIGSETLVGDKFVDITSGRSARHLDPGGEVPFKPQSELLKSLDMTQFEAQLRSIDDTIRDLAEGRSQVGQFVQGEQMYNDLRRRTAEIERAMRAAASTTSSVGQALYTDQLYQRISQPIEDLDSALARLEKGQGQAGQLLRDPAQYDQWRSQTEGLRRSISDMRATAFLKNDHMYQDWNRTLAALVRQVDDANATPMMISTEAYENLNGLAGHMRDGLREFRQDPQKFLRLKIF